MSLVALLGLSFLMGLKHAMDADHVVTISVVVAEKKTLRHSSLVGVSWALGHSVMIGIAVLVVGLWKIGFADSFIRVVDMAVAMIMIGLGVKVFRQTYKQHQDSPSLHEQEPQGKPREKDVAAGASAGQQRIAVYVKPFCIGLVHGLAGSAALQLLLAATLDGLEQMILYLVVFGAGTIGGMLICTLLLSMPMIFSLRWHAFHHHIQQGIGVLSVVFGLVLLAEVGNGWLQGIL